MRPELAHPPMTAAAAAKAAAYRSEVIDLVRKTVDTHDVVWSGWAGTLT